MRCFILIWCLILHSLSTLSTTLCPMVSNCSLTKCKCAVCCSFIYPPMQHEPSIMLLLSFSHDPGIIELVTAVLTRSIKVCWQCEMLLSYASTALIHCYCRCVSMRLKMIILELLKHWRPSSQRSWSSTSIMAWRRYALFAGRKCLQLVSCCLILS